MTYPQIKDYLTAISPTASEKSTEKSPTLSDKFITPATELVSMLSFSHIVEILQGERNEPWGQSSCWHSALHSQRWLDGGVCFGWHGQQPVCLYLYAFVARQENTTRLSVKGDLQMIETRFKDTESKGVKGVRTILRGTRDSSRKWRLQD